jgi:hypothetical protein
MPSWFAKLLELLLPIGTKGGVQQLFWDNYWHLLPTTAPLLSLIFLQPVNSSFISSHFLSSHLSSCVQVEAEARGVPARRREAQPPTWCGTRFFLQTGRRLPPAGGKGIPQLYKRLPLFTAQIQIFKLNA